MRRDLTLADYFGWSQYFQAQLPEEEKPKERDMFAAFKAISSPME